MHTQYYIGNLFGGNDQTGAETIKKNKDTGDTEYKKTKNAPKCYRESIFFRIIYLQ